MELPTLDYLNDMSKGDVTFINKILSVIQEELPKEQEDYCNFIDEESWNEAADLVHKIKHKFTIFGLINAVDLANTHENELRNNNLDHHQTFNNWMNLVKKFVQDCTTV